MQAVSRARGVLLDLDGTLVSGGTALPGAAGLLDGVGGRFASCRTMPNTPRPSSRESLGGSAWSCRERRILLAGAVALEQIAARARRTDHAAGSLALTALCRCGSGSTPVAARAGRSCVLGRDRGFSFARLARARRMRCARGAAARWSAIPTCASGPQRAVVRRRPALAGRRCWPAQAIATGTDRQAGTGAVPRRHGGCSAYQPRGSA